MLMLEKSSYSLFVFVQHSEVSYKSLDLYWVLLNMPRHQSYTNPCFLFYCIFFIHIKASFPGNLHLVLVLRPTSFFHRTVTDIGFRFSQEDFMLKMPVRQLLLSYQTCVPSKRGTPHSYYNLELHKSHVFWWTPPRTENWFQYELLT